MEQQNIYNYNPFAVSPKKNEKKQIKKTALFVGIPVILVFVLTFKWASIYYSVTSSLGIEIKKAYEIICEPAVLCIIQILFSLIGFLLFSTVSAKIAGERISDLVPFERPKSGLTLPLFLFGIGFCTFSNISVSFAGDFFESFGVNYSVDYGENPNGVTGFLLTLFSTAFIPALAEEFCFRGVFFGLTKKYGDIFALITTSVMFGVMHGNFEQMPFAILVGFVLGMIRLKTGSIWGCILLHFYNNFSSVVFDYLFDGVSGEYQSAFFIVFYSLCLLVGLIGILIFSSREKENFNENGVKTVSSEKEKLIWFLTSPVIIIFLVIHIGESFKYFIG